MASRRRELSITIPPEIITEILYRLPAKSIGRFRCVSKAWLSQLTTPNFIKIHLSISSRQNHLIFKTPDIRRSINESGSLFLYSLPFHSGEVVTEFNVQLTSNAFYTDVRGSCDGLVLVHVLCNLGETVVVINPTTKECLQLPKLDYHKTSNNEYVKLSSLYGFGYDSVTDDYKVVSLTRYFCINDADKVYVDVYSLRNKKWKRVTDSPYGYPISCGVFVDGFIHWFVRNDNGDLIGIGAFSLADERFSKIPFPKLCNTLKSYDCQLLVLGGKLAIFIKSEGVVWLMNEYGVRESWTKILLHGTDNVPLFEPKRVFDDNGKILVANNERMMVYEVEKASFTETVCAWNSEMFRIVGFYLESLVSPKLGKEEEDDDNVESKEDDGYKFWKAKHRMEKLRGDRLEGELTHALTKQQFLTHRMEATIWSNLVNIQALERRSMEQDDEIESLKARLAVADEERRNAIAALSEMVNNTLN